ncbi:GTPase Era, mitochondrial [Onthophagus taurus]|uniref:GTPase Era, mitochondrial n=1 Tax=Onthophagus taurus TaxID=166361 RepID=UPI0039BEB09F
MFIKTLFLRKIPDFLIITTRKCTTNQNLQPEEATQRILKVAIIGMPNAGKSTFINNLVERRVCPTSSKVHTTKNRASAIFTEGDAQIVFMDTPGLINDREMKKFNLPYSYMFDSRTTMDKADIIGVIHDVGNPYTREKLDIKIIKSLHKHKKQPSFLVLNKIDLLKSKRKLLDVIRLVTEGALRGKKMLQENLEDNSEKEEIKNESDHKGWRFFTEIFMVSSLTGDGLVDIKNFLSLQAKPGKWLFPEEEFTDQPPETIIINTVKATLLNFLPQEMPYLLKVELEHFEMNPDGVIICTVLVRCKTDRIVKYVTGEQDGKVRQITRSVQENLQNTFRNFVRINIIVQKE